MTPSKPEMAQERWGWTKKNKYLIIGEKCWIDCSGDSATLKRVWGRETASSLRGDAIWQRNRIFHRRENVNAVAKTEHNERNGFVTVTDKMWKVKEDEKKSV
ncbi:hypothetical protein TNCV_381031 [Trichonephila clavipes]|uniref:Uncharacterized protein n=1 Tax=Trichonephila clavipes TaxID=2585209 RepID=A0A8X6VJ46_TRICX|nr:hypothetical protein TNCV_381031 [Trichonephila clavipes]